MRVLHVVSSLNVGGAERFVIDLASEQLANQKLSVGILSMGLQGEPLETEIAKEEFRLHFATSISKIRAILKNYDLVHVHSSHSLLRILLASFFTHIRVVYTRHNERVHQSLKWKFIYFLARLKLDKMIFVAEKALKNYLSVYPQFAKKSVTILNGVLPISPIKSASTKLRLSHVGRFVPLKAQHYLIEAVAKLSPDIQQQLSLSFFGTGELMAYNQQLATDLIPNVEVTFHGFVTDRDIIYQQTDVLIVTSETEGLSLAILEALASGTPTIASNVGGNPELVKHRHNGLLYSYADAAGLAEQISLFLEDQSLLKEYSQRCIDIYQAGFSMQQCAKTYRSHY
ncbi:MULTISPECIES: glycosyltransferase family 4 protein [unclassified Colwellia]|jgi:glycosyltransferase involved in cell wall biosynthesis|uniref:glycosyltransferase family 4 protein n=1 Tax=unclassified Colwellia TaxID=196834 RepID=UPI0015F707AC|nr:MULTISPECIES: glycosyltransferase family 4 protein [unclassified Colwellia]MBA6252580.1 glycosyltransferase family 4 protein [Colwellia sp. MB3u-55]MBA6397194.1 glycosyltransferase family 4 protein [Colwellia sp. BRX10-4]